MTRRAASALFSIAALLLFAACTGVNPHGVVVVDTPQGPVEVRFNDGAQPARMARSVGGLKIKTVFWGSGDGGAAVSPYHSEGQAQVLRDEGYIGVYRRYIEPLNVPPGYSVMWHYPFTERGRAYMLSQNRNEPGLNEVARRLHSRGVEFIVYLPCPTSGTTWQFPKVEDQVREIRRLFACVPPTAAIAIDAIASTTPAGRIALEQERASGRVIYGEPFRFTYALWMRYPTIENSDHWMLHEGDTTRVAEPRHTIVKHHQTPEEWDIGAVTISFAEWCEGRGFRWFAQAEELVNAPVPLTLANVDPRSN